MIIDGRTLAQDLLARIQTQASELKQSPKILTIVTDDTLPTHSYLAIKEKRAKDAGCVLNILRLPADSDTETLRTEVQRASATADAIIVQLPLSQEVDTRAVCDSIPFMKDADVLGSEARSKFMRGDTDALLPPVVGAVREVLAQNAISVEGKQIVVIGDGFLVGAPCAAWLAQKGACVMVVRDKKTDITEALLGADIIVSGIGSPHLIKPEMIKEGVILIDAGTSELSGEIVGDADPACASKCTLFTPVPGGIGPIAVAMLFRNTVALSTRAHE